MRAGSKSLIEGGVEHRLRLHDPGQGRAGRSAAPVAGAARRRRRSREPRRHRRLCRSAHGARACSSRRCAIAGDRLCCGHFHDTRGLGLANVYAALADRRRALRRLPRGHRRLPACAGCERQRRDRGPRLHAREHGRLDRHRLRSRCSRCAPRSRNGSKARRCTARYGAPACRRRMLAAATAA